MSTRESSDIAITLTAGPSFFLSFILIFYFCILLSLFFTFWEACRYRAGALARQTEKDRETGSEKSPPRGDGHVTIPSPPFSSRDLGHACTCAWCEFKPPGPGLEPRLATWEFSDIAIMLTAGPLA